jgi:hypothetical protein
MEIKDKKSSNYSSLQELKKYESPSIEGDNFRYAGRISGALKKVPSNLWRHKGKVMTGVAEAVEVPAVIKYLSDLKGVASNALVEAGLKMGKVITYPVKPEIFHINLLDWGSKWAYIADTHGQLPMNPSYETNTLVSGLLNAAKDPVTSGIIVGAAIAAPLIIYGVGRAVKHLYEGKDKK